MSFVRVNLGDAEGEKREGEKFEGVLRRRSVGDGREQCGFFGSGFSIGRRLKGAEYSFHWVLVLVDCR